jgi:hypothetical protein
MSDKVRSTRTIGLHFIVASRCTLTQWYCCACSRRCCLQWHIRHTNQCQLRQRTVQWHLKRWPLSQPRLASLWLASLVTCNTTTYVCINNVGSLLCCNINTRYACPIPTGYCAFDSMASKILHYDRWVTAQNHRKHRQGLITVMNHTCALDDPVTVVQLMTFRNLLRPCQMRWTLGASDMMFTSPITSLLFRWLKVISITRSGGLDQPVCREQTTTTTTQTTQVMMMSHHQHQVLCALHDASALMELCMAGDTLCNRSTESRPVDQYLSGRSNIARWRTASDTTWYAQRNGDHSVLHCKPTNQAL